MTKRTRWLCLALLTLAASTAYSGIAQALPAGGPLWFTKEGANPVKELKTGEKMAITGSGAESKLLTTGPSTEIEAEKYAETGEIIGGKPGTLLATVTLEKVKLKNIAACEVKSIGSPSGTVVAEKIHGTLGFLSKSESQVGILAEGTETLVIEGKEFTKVLATVEITGASCPLKFKSALTGALIEVVTPIKLVQTSLETFSRASGGIQEFEEIEIWNPPTESFLNKIKVKIKLEIGFNPITWAKTGKFSPTISISIEP